MRFASLGSSNAGDYASAGKQAANSAIRSFAVQRKTGPDYAGLSKVAMAAQTAEKIAANEAGAQFAKASIDAVADVKQQQLESEADLKYTDQVIKLTDLKPNCELVPSSSSDTVSLLPAILLHCAEMSVGIFQWDFSNTSPQGSFKKLLQSFSFCVVKSITGGGKTGQPLSFNVYNVFVS